MALQDILDSLNLLSKKEVQGKMTRKSGKILAVNPDSTYDVEVDNVLIPRMPAERREEKYPEGESVVVSYTYGECHMYQISGRSSYAIPEVHRHEFSSAPAKTPEILLSLDNSDYNISKYFLTGSATGNISLAHPATYLSVNKSLKNIYAISAYGIAQKYKSWGILENVFDTEMECCGIAHHPSFDIIYTISEADKEIKRINLGTKEITTFCILPDGIYNDIVTNQEGVYVSFYSSSHKISKYSFSGGLITTALTPEGLNLAAGLNNQIYAYNFSEIYKLNSNLVLLTTFADKAGHSLAVDKNSNMYIYKSGGYSSGYIYKYDSKGNEDTFWEGEGQDLCII